MTIWFSTLGSGLLVSALLLAAGCGSGTVSGRDGAVPDDGRDAAGEEGRSDAGGDPVDGGGDQGPNDAGTDAGTDAGSDNGADGSADAGDGGDQAPVDGGPSWQPLGPPGGSIWSVAVDPANPATVYALGLLGAIYRSDDSGGHWTGLGSVAYAGMHANHASFQFDPVDSSTLYLEVDRLLRSRDRGATWTAVSTESPDALTVHPQDPLTLLMAVAENPQPPTKRLLRTTDGGQTWQSISIPAPPDVVYGIGIDPRVPSNVLLATNNISAPASVRKSTDGGNTWSSGISALVLGFAFHPTLAANVLGFGWGGLYSSPDSGDTWTAVATLPESRQVLGFAIDPAVPLNWYTATFDGGADPNGVYYKLFKSLDAGANWILSGTGLSVDHGLQSLAMDPAHPATLFGGAVVGGVWVTRDGAATWATCNHWLNAMTISAVAVVPGTPDALLLDSADRSLDAGATWLPFGPAPGNQDWVYIRSLAVDPTPPGVVFATGMIGASYAWKLLKSADLGATWTDLSPPAPTFDHGVVALAPSDAQVLYAGTCNEGLFMSSNGGASWSSSSDPLLMSRCLDQIRVDPADSSKLFACATAGPVLRSDDGGQTWMVISQLACPIALDPRQPGTLYAADATTLYRSDDSGTTWNAVGASNGWVRDLLLDSTPPATLFAAVDGLGVLASTDGGQTWTPLGTGLPTSEVIVLGLSTSPAAQILVGTRSMGLFGLPRTGG